MRACDFDRYVGLPYKDRGRDLDGLDCWGLVRLVYADQGVDLPCYSDEYKTSADDAAIAALVAGHADPWREVPESLAVSMDAVLMRLGRIEAHIGLVVRRGLVLHVGPGFASRIEPYGSMRLSRRVTRFMRYEGHHPNNAPA